MISKAVGNGIFTTIERPPYGNLACALFEVSKSWEWIWFSFLELIKLEVNFKNSLFSSVSQQWEQMLRFGTKRTKTGGEVLPAQAVKQLQPAILFPVTGQTFQPTVHVCGWNGCYCLSLSELSGSFSRPPHQQAALLCCQVVEKNFLALLVHFTALATPAGTQAIGNASGTSTQHLVAAFNSPFRNSTLSITKTAAMMFWR